MSYKFKRKKIALIVGNGLTLDLLEYLNLKEYWNSSNPFSWKDKINKPEEYKTKNFEEMFPKLSLVIQNFGKNKSDFEMLYYIFSNKNKVVKFLSNKYNTPNYLLLWGILRNEIEHYFSFAFSTFQRIIEKYQKEIECWSYFKWINKNKKSIKFIISFNYDLIIELLLKKNKIEYHSFGIEGESLTGIPLLKPHGSVDYEVSNNAININKLKYPLDNAFTWNDTPLIRIDRNELFKVRKISPYVLPSEYSQISNYQWIKPGYADFKTKIKNVDTVYLIGHSYSEFDKNELLQNIIIHIKPNTKVVIVNPKPNNDLIKDLKNNGLNVSIKTNSKELL
ncbi:hypothetical protein XO12_02290 [Marinitoga sp. 1154]|uniref:hypothetical protein n=1 Tax=Marinitoga sp. 1154 TaxID=1643335 RepID=UPI00158645BE|nr:hypothetical protein [Marinitoga sp. 1154]NUU98989.1 hypothetical protein [Marinitoga sp. 1154]